MPSPLGPATVTMVGQSATSLSLGRFTASVTTNAAPELFYRQLPLLDFILKGGLPATIKAGLRLTGLESGDPRLPVRPAIRNFIERDIGVSSGKKKGGRIMRPP